MKIRTNKINSLDLIIDFLFSIITVRNMDDSNIKYFYQPLKQIRFLKNNKYKIIRFLSYISPWLIFPYTLFTFLIWIVAVLLLLLTIPVWFICNYVINLLSDFKFFWNKL